MPPPGRAVKRKMDFGPYLYVLPVMIVFAVFLLVPLAQGVWYSFTSWDGIGPATWVGLSNYISIWTDPVMREGLANTGVLVLFYAGLPIVLGLFTAAVIGRRGMRGMGFFRTVLFLPQILSSVVVIVVWRLLLAPSGPVNGVLGTVGLGFLEQDWLGSFSITLDVLGLIGAWVAFGFCMLLFLAGIQAIPAELYDAAKVDGATPLREFFTVTLPGLRGQLAVATTLSVIGAFQAFDIIWLVTQGGPGTSSITPSINLYNDAFVSQDVGAAAAMGVVMLAASLVVTLVIVKLVEERRRA